VKDLEVSDFLQPIFRSDADGETMGRRIWGGGSEDGILSGVPLSVKNSTGAGDASVMRGVAG